MLCSPRTDRHTHRQTHTRESEYRGYPFRVSGMFPSTYHQGSVHSLLQLVTDKPLTAFSSIFSFTFSDFEYIELISWYTRNNQRLQRYCIMTHIYQKRREGSYWSDAEHLIYMGHNTIRLKSLVVSSVPTN